ncbi:Pre-mRNA-splicing factor SPP2 [Smittium culicis]|uniref:Pre-mRNA-splicing factor SPP2 n=2 Tax=Smittium culicis TaxID=133412 RepID=A0A1R1XAT4_9FUNG|nr:Pre-mRNA-splicing factor SPP2 [Smittium culicis]
MKKTSNSFAKPINENKVKSSFGYNAIEENKTNKILIDKIEGNKIFRTDGVDEDAKLIIKVPENVNWVESQLLKRKQKLKENSLKEKIIEESRDNQISSKNSKLMSTVPESYGLLILDKKAPKIKEEDKKALVENEVSAPIKLSFETEEDLRLEAIKELLTDNTAINKKQMEISMQEGTKTFADKEKRAFEEEIDLMADEMTLEDYEKVPVEDFGAALLRGMGWDEDEEPETKKAKNKHLSSAMRPNLLGLGATPPPSELFFDKRKGFTGVEPKSKRE